MSRVNTHSPSSAVAALALTLALGLAASSALAISSPFVDPPGPTLPPDPGGSMANSFLSYSYLFWVVEGANSSAYNGYTAVLVRGNEAIDIDNGSTGTVLNNAVPTVTYNDVLGSWELNGGVIHAIATLGSNIGGSNQGFMTVNDDRNDYLKNIDRLEMGDWHYTTHTYTQQYVPDPLTVVENHAKWGTQATLNSYNTFQTLDTAYPYYMFIFDTSSSRSGSISDNGNQYPGHPNYIPPFSVGPDAFVGMWYEELNVSDNLVPELQQGSFENMINVLVVRFSEPVPEPTAAALLALGAACLGLRRRFRR